MNNNFRQFSTWASLVLIAFILSFTSGGIILSGIYETKLKTQSMSPLEQAVSLDLLSPNSGQIPTPGKDFKLTKSTYFDNNSWVIANISYLPDNNAAALVLEKINNVYDVVLGPATAFSLSSTYSLPGDVAQYLTSNYLITGTN